MSQVICLTILVMLGLHGWDIVHVHKLEGLKAIACFFFQFFLVTKIVLSIGRCLKNGNFLHEDSPKSSYEGKIKYK
jgi:hypothetical protein